MSLFLPVYVKVSFVRRIHQSPAIVIHRRVEALFISTDV